MMNHLLRRRFVNMVSENCKSATCLLHRLNVSDHLFYPSTAEAEAAKPTAAAISRLESLPDQTSASNWNRDYLTCTSFSRW